jgi:hypothetical protein
LGTGTNYLWHLNHVKVIDFFKAIETRKGGGFVNQTKQEMFEE